MTTQKEGIKTIGAPSFRGQVALFLLAAHRLAFSVIPSHFLKRKYLSLFGSRIGSFSYIHRGVRLLTFGRLEIGDHTTVNMGCILDARGGLKIGNNVMIGHFCKIYSCGHSIDSATFDLTYRPVLIEDDVVVFPNSLVVPGVTLRRGCVVLPGSVVVRDVDPYSVVGGNPAAFVRTRTADIKYLFNYGPWLPNS